MAQVCLDRPRFMSIPYSIAIVAGRVAGFLGDTPLTKESIQMLQKEHNGTYLFAVNIAAAGVVVEFSNLPAGAVAVEVLFEDRRIPVSGDSFQDSFAQDDVHIYRVITGA